MTLTPNQALTKLQELKRLTEFYSLFLYKPHPKQIEFHNAGKTRDQRCLMAGNQLGKTYAAGCETAMHLTGLYPDWWDGRRFKKATRFWAGSKNADVARDGAQRILLGPVNALGTGAIPRDRILEIKKARGVPDAVESVLVKHKGGDQSLLVFKGYLDGREAWQAETLDGVWFDEEPPIEIYSEGLTRTNNTRGIAYLTFTPLLGMTLVVLKFWNNRDNALPGTHLTMMTIDDACHLTPEDRERIISRYEPHQLEARANGIPLLGSGKVFEVDESFLLEPPLTAIPDDWLQIIGLDFGWEHPTAATRLVLEPENDILHVVSAYRQAKQTPIIHASAIKKWGGWQPVAWPRDGLQTDKGSGKELAEIYRGEGLCMRDDFAQFADKRGVGVEAGLIEMDMRMRTGRFKVAKNLHDWIDEYRMYHRVDGQVVKMLEDLICSTRYAVMDLRFAQSSQMMEAQKEGDRYSRQRRKHSGTTWMSN